MQRSLLDNWSLEHAGVLLNGDTDIGSIPQDKFILSFGGLSNYINALLLYDETNYLSNGFESEWTRFPWFTQNTVCYIGGLSAESLEIDWESEESYSDQGISNYLKSADKLGLDLFVSPERSTQLKGRILKNSISTIDPFLKNIDDHILKEADTLWVPDTQFGIAENFIFPSLTQYILSKTSRYDELFTVILQIKHDGKINKAIIELQEISKDTRRLGRLQKEIESRIKFAFGDKSKSDTSFALKLSVLFLSLNKSFSLNFFNRKGHFLFLNDIISSRAEAGELRKSIKRIFDKTLE